jgi:hypothetical protein
MSVNLKIDNPVIAIMGPESAVGWGPCQFPALKKMPDGRLVLQYHVGQDSCEEYGKGSGWLISDDNGDSWRDVSPEEMPMVIGCFGTKLPSGKYIRIITPPNHPVDKDFYKAYPNRGRIGEDYGSGCGWSLPAEELPQDLFPMGWQYGIYDPSTGEDETYFCDLDYPGMNIHFLGTGSLVRPFPYDNLCVAPDGTLWQATYHFGRNPETLEHTAPYLACYFFQSLDEGKSFKLKSWIQYKPDTDEFPNAFNVEGFCEPYLSFLPDGSMVTLIRTSSSTPSYIAHSYDGGNTWTKPEKFDRIGVFPQLLTLDCGVTLASYGRPGVFLRATDDPHGKEWDVPIEILPFIPFDTWTWGCDSCSYTGLLPLDERTAILAYSDFRLKDEEGKERKCLLVRKIHVE